MNKERLKYIKTEIQSLGVKIAGPNLKKGGAGPAEGYTLILDDIIPATVPVSSPFVEDSPYTLSTDSSITWLEKNGERICTIRIIPQPQFYTRETADGTPCWKIALRHGTDCLATTVFQRCIYWKTKNRCKFCGIELSLESGQTIAEKTPEQLAETADLAVKLDGVKHVTLTTGSQADPNKDILLLCRCTEEIKKRTGIPVHVQMEPAGSLSTIDALKDSGADTIGIHIESFDMDVLRYAAPAKAEYGLEKYLRFWKWAVKIFGVNQVSSFILAGLGEDENSIIEGSKILTDTGAYPYVIPLRPIPGSAMEKSRPPEPEVMIRIYNEVSEIIRRGGLSSKNSLAGCVRCGACSAVTDFE